MEKKPHRKSAASWQASDEKKNRKAHAACRKAPAGGKIYLPALSAPKSRLGQVWVRRKSHRILHRKKFGICRKIRLKSEDFSRIWSECRDSNPRPLGPEPSAIPNFATPRDFGIIVNRNRFVKCPAEFFTLSATPAAGAW